MTGAGARLEALAPGTATLILRKEGLLSRERTLHADDTPVARMRSDRWSDGADLTTADGEWRLKGTGFWRRTGEILVAATGESVGQTAQRGFWGRTTGVTLDGRTLALARPSGWRRRFTLEDAQGATLAEIRPHRSDLDVETRGPASALEIAVACWLVLAIRRGEDAAAGSVATSAATSA